MRHLSLLLLLLCTLLRLDPALAEQREVRVYNWIEYLPKDVIKDFEQQTGIHVQYDVFDNVQTMESKLLTGNSGYDVVFPSGSQLGKLIKAKALVPLDRAQLPNWKNLDPAFMNRLAVNDPDNRFAGPYLWGTTLIGYNVAKIHEIFGPEVQFDSWDFIFKPENIAKLKQCGVAFLDAPEEILPIALHYLGLPPNSDKREDYAKAQALMLSIRPSILYFSSAKFPVDLANGDICVAVGWSGAFTQARNMAKAAGKGIDIAMSLPRGGTLQWADVIAIPQGVRHPSEAHAFIDFLLRPEVIARISNTLEYPNPNLPAQPLIDARLRSDPNIFVPEARRAELFMQTPADLALDRLRTRVWTTIRNGQ